ncbi:MAG: rane fusion protein multidrug efflux system [Acidobacteriota bacterium]|nr:rane fusion protein multidrug efflux system [Acidobacteriota bacterium]
MKINQLKPSTTIHVLFIIILLIIGFTGCSKDPAESLGRKPGGAGGGRMAITFPVETVTVKNQSVTYSIYAVGSVEAFEMVMVTARVSGVVDKVLFSEGTLVQAGRELVEIEPERYRLAVESAKAAWEKAKAARADAEAGLKRRQQVVEKNPGLIPGEELETWSTRVRTAMAEVALTQAQLNQAELNLHDALVRAPVAGVVQTRTVQTGQYVQPGVVLATMIRRDPLLLRFKVPEQDAGRLKPGLKALFTIKNDKTEYTSTIAYVAASADENTRMAAVTAAIDDENRDRLRPGAFAEIHIPVGSVQDVPVIPQLAIRPGERGFISYVVENGTAKERILTLGMRTADGQVEIRDGLKACEALVIRGAEALQDNVAVRVTRADGAEVSQPVKEKKGADA